jgi:hypothetical protein
MLPVPSAVWDGRLAGVFGFSAGHQSNSTSEGWADAPVREIVKEYLSSVLGKVEISAMHDILVALVLMAVVMFPCFITTEMPK